MKKVFIFTSVHQWNDVRIYHKEAQSLSAAYDVQLHAPSDFEYKQCGNLKVFGLPKWEKVSDRKLIRRELFKRIKESDAEIFHFHDPELIFLGLYVKLILNRKVIYDVHEDVSKQILNKEYIPTKWLKKIISFGFSILEKVAISLFNGVIVAGEDILRTYRKRTIVNNYPIIKAIIDDRTLDNNLVYLGGITKIRGIEEILKGLLIANKTLDKNVKLKLIGKFSDFKFKNYILKKYSEIIEYVGWMDRDRAMKEVQKSIAGVVLYLPVPNHMFLRSNKIFEYMEAGIPVIYSQFPDWEEKLKKFNVGLSVDPTDIESIAEKITWFINNPSEAKSMSNNGFKTVSAHYNWKLEEKKLLQLYEDIS